MDLANGALRQIVTRLPKIELHRHLEASFRLSTLIEIAIEHNIEMPEYTIEMLRPFVQMMPGEERSPQHFLAKFLTLRQFFCSPEIIRRVTREAIEDAAADNIKYMELRLTPRALSNILNCSFQSVMEWICAEVEAAQALHDIQVRLILSMNRHESVEIGQQVLEVALAFRDRGVVAVDLAGNEQEYSAKPFQDIFHRARVEGLGITIHAGEWAGAQNIRDAVETLYADRIGHGVRVIDDPRLIHWLAEHGTALEICPTSNVDSGVVADWHEHPLPHLYREGVTTTINTDDPLICNITLTDEIIRAIDEMDFTLDDIKRNILNAAQSAFLPPAERAALVSRFRQMLEFDT